MPQLLEVRRIDVIEGAARKKPGDRSKDGRFAKKGTGDQTGGKGRLENDLASKLAKEQGITPEEAKKRLADEMAVGDAKEKARRAHLGLDKKLSKADEVELKKLADSGDADAKEALSRRAKPPSAAKPPAPTGLDLDELKRKAEEKTKADLAKLPRSSKPVRDAVKGVNVVKPITVKTVTPSPKVLRGKVAAGIAKAVGAVTGALGATGAYLGREAFRIGSLARVAAATPQGKAVLAVAGLAALVGFAAYRGAQNREQTEPVSSDNKKRAWLLAEAGMAIGAATIFKSGLTRDGHLRKLIERMRAAK